MGLFPESKYFAKYKGAAPKLLEDSESPYIDFRLERMNPSSATGRLKAKFASLVIKLLLWFGMRFHPWMRIGRWLIVTRHKDVEFVLNNPQNFITPFNPEMNAVADGATFMLGLDGHEHQRQREFVQSWMADKHLDVYSQFKEDCTNVASALLLSAPGEIDVMKDYFTRVSTEAAQRLLGIKIDDPDSFGDWSIALSAMIFGDPTGDPVVCELASHASWQMRGLVDRSITKQRNNSQPLQGLIGACIKDGTWTDAEIRALVMGIAIGLVPTVTLMAGNILSWLLEQPKIWDKAKKAALKKDDKTLRSILLEAGRLRPALWPGQFRLTTADVTLPSGRTIPSNTVVLAATATALRDPRQYKRPNQFSTDRDLDNDPINLTFGTLPHACLGRHLATSQLGIMFAQLLSLTDVTQAKGEKGRLTKVQAFPRHQIMQFSNPARPGFHSMAMIIVPVRPDADAAKLSHDLEKLGNPAHDPLNKALTSAGGIHFFSLNLVDIGTHNAPEKLLLMELNADGEAHQALNSIAEAAFSQLAPIFEYTSWSASEQLLGDFWHAHARHNSINPAKFTGLDYNGTTGFSLCDKMEQSDLAEFAGRAVDWVQRQRLGSGGRPMARLEAVRALIQGDIETLERAFQKPFSQNLSAFVMQKLIDERAILLADGAKFRSMLYLPSTRRLPFVDHLEQSRLRSFSNYLNSTDARPIWGALLVLLIIGAAFLSSVLVGDNWHWVARITGGLLWSIVLLIFSVAGMMTLLFWRLRNAEIADRPDERDANLSHVKNIVRREDMPGFQQNHVLSMSTFKQGWIRRLSFAFAMWGIGVYCKWLARPGFILSMGTIHFARWYRLPGKMGAKLMFHSNYDGSWESYLEDFIMKAHIGQTAAWSHGEGFPRTESLIFKGAQDGPRFKRWTRRQQLATQCWWTATPDLTLDRMRTNALIHDGLARAASDSAAREWLSLFGSQCRPHAAIETEEVQTIVFRGMGRRPFGLTIGLRLPATKPAAVEVLRLLIGEHANPLKAVPTISFGERPWGNGGTDPLAAVAISAVGLVNLGIAKDLESLSGFPFSFRQGMRERWRQLKDAENAAWTVDDKHDLLLHYLFVTEAEALSAHAELECRIGGQGLCATLGFIQFTHPSPHPTTGKDSVEFEPFGFRDGVSQPALRGTLAEPIAHPDNLLEPGEFILGYRAGGDQVAPGPRIPRQQDAYDLLPDTSSEPDQAWPSFRKQQLGASSWRDLGRNGSYLVLRQFRQDVDGFRAFCDLTAADLKARYPGLTEALGVVVNGDWVAGKIVGRWQDGIALNRRPRPPRTDSKDFVEHPDTAVQFGREDARGFGCPLGAHVRRANPRDSLLPDDPSAITIANRHRLIRRGRAWRNADKSRGLTFIALCADIERQFEFVQSQWLAAKSFHGLANEVDPLVIGQTAFSIPTTAGPVRISIPNSYVSLEGGGYFFLPSRSALRFMVSENAVADR